MDKAMTGAYGELYAGRLLREKGYDILDANYRCRMGEIDIIASDKKYICFVEVKTRDENTLFRPSDAVNSAKRQRIIAAAGFYLSHNKTKLQPRFDVVEILMRGDDAVSVNHIENAYGAEGK